MNINTFRMHVNRSTVDDIIIHLNECSSTFIPALSTYINIVEYSNKIYNGSTRYELYDNFKLIGLLALYDNDDNLNFITNLSVLPSYQNKGVARYLLDKCKRDVLTKDNKCITLEVFKDNINAINFYINNNFKLLETNGNILTLKWNKKI